LAPNESYRVRGEDGKILLMVVRNWVPQDISAAWADIEAHHERHADMWGLGCEADPEFKSFVN
jgi:hypothetical protein